MPEGQVLEFSGVTKRFGAVTAVDGFTARVEPGRVTGFLGPNGAGKTTTLRMLLGLVRPTSGTATVGGVPYARLRDPLRSVGAVLEASSFHPGRTGANHLKVYARAAGLPDSRVDDTLGMVGLADVGGRKVGGYSLGMRQRLGLAYALLGDPGVLVLDEPANGLDPEGIKWMRGLLRDLARQGRTVLVSSHLLTEVQQTVDSLVIISRGRLVFQGGLEELTDPSEYTTVVDSSDRAALAAALRSADVESEILRSGLVVRGVDPGTVGAAAASAGVALTLLQRRGPALEEVFLDLVNGVRVHPSAGGVPVAEAVPTAEEVPAAEEVPVVEEVAAVAVLAEATGAPESDEISEHDAADALVAEEVITAGEVSAALEDEQVEEEPESAGSEPEPADAEGSAPAPDAAAAGFVVAATGIIDVVPTASEPAEPVPAPEPDVEPADEHVSTGSVFSVGSSGETVSTEAISIVETSDEPVDDSDAGEPEGDAERPWEQYVKTEADLEADRFFSTFTREEAARLAAEEAASTGSAESAESAAEAEPDEQSWSDGDPWREQQPWGAGDSGQEAEADHRDADDREEGDQR